MRSSRARVAPLRRSAPTTCALACIGGTYLVAVLAGLLLAHVQPDPWGTETVSAWGPMSSDRDLDALLRAIDERDPARVAALAAGRAAGKLNATDDAGRTPLTCAVRRTGPGTRDVIRALLAAGADPRRESSGCTPLAEAVRAREDDAAAVAADLLAAGADPNGLHRLGHSPLHWAAQPSADPHLVELLLAAGADPSAKDGDGLTPLDWAVRDDCPAAARLLRDAR